MEITLLSPESIKIRGKHAALIVDPFGFKGKQSSDVILLLHRSNEKISSVENNKLIVDGAGEYEVSGVKITAFTIGEDNVYIVTQDGLEILIAKSNSLVKAKDILGDYHVVLLNATTAANLSIITSLNANVVCLFGEKKDENAKSIGAANTKTTNKFTVTKEKLPSETEVIIFG